MSEGIKCPDQFVFGLDIGTRSLVGTIGYMDSYGFHVVAMEVVEHTTRAMMDGQVHDINVVADEINQLATGSRETAQKSNESHEKILKAIEMIQKDTKNLLEIIREVNEKTASLAAVTEEITASNELILEATGTVKQNLEELTNMKEI